MITLDPTLQTALDGDSHRPVIEILTSPVTTDLPMEGHHLTGNTEEIQPSAIVMASGKLVVAYHGDQSIYLMISDNDRVEWMAPIKAAYGFTVSVALDVALAETADGNIGMVYRAGNSLYRAVFSPFGVAVNAQAGISYSTSYTCGNLSVLRLANDTYLMAQAAQNADSEWAILTRTSADFLTWSAETAVSVSGFATSQALANPHLMQLDTGAVWLFFDAVEASAAINVYQMASADNGTTWGAPAAITTNTEIAEKAQQPCAVQKTSNRVDLAWVDSSAVITQEHSALALDGGVLVDYMHFDPATRMLYLLDVHGGAGKKYLDNVIRVNVDTWSVDKIWDTDTVPAIPYIFGQYHVWWQRHYATPGSRIGWALIGDYRQAAVLDGDADTITHYAFDDWPEHGITKNVAWEPALNGLGLKSTFLDNDNDRLYVLFHNSYVHSANSLQLGYIDLTDPGPEYTFRDIVASNNFLWPGHPQYGDHRFKVYADSDLVIINHESPLSYQPGGLVILHLTTGAAYKLYNKANYSLFPFLGVRFFELDGNSVYCAFDYTATDPEKLKRGLLEINLLTDQMTYHIPPWSDDTEYEITSITKIADNELLVTSSKYGSAIFNTLTKGWIHYDAADMAGYNNNQWCGAYDPVQEMVFTGRDKLYGFLRSGPVKQIMTRSVNPGDLSTVISDQLLTRGFREYSPTLALPPDEINFYAFWTRSDAQVSEWVSWGMESSSKYIQDYLTSAGLTTTKSIEGDPHELTMTLSHGHLFDPQNHMSLWSIYLQKGRLISVRLGETVNGTDHLTSEGQFVITACRLKYQRGSYPVIEVTAQDRRCLWQYNNVVATDYYQMLPGATCAHLVGQYTDIAEANIDFPVMDNGILLETQWVDTTLFEMVQQVCDRFGYFCYMTPSGKITARKISRDGEVVHIYPDSLQVVNFSPDDTYSDFTNRVTITGEERNFIEVMYDEERIKSLSGTVGWWGYKNDFTVRYSEDKSRRCRYPRLDVLESATSIMFQLAGSIKESISYIDTDEDKYCIVTVSAPSLVPVLVAAIAAWAAAHYIPDVVVSWGGGTTIPVGRIIESVSMIVAMMVLGSVGNFQYEVYARPLGLVRRSIHATADDTDLQSSLGEVIESKDEGWCTYTVPQCQTVADYNMMLAQLQRNRITMQKTAHLQDEIGDTIQLPHPYSKEALKMFITDIVRTYQPGGVCTDDITGWRL